MDIRWIYSVEWQLKEDTAIWTTYHCWVLLPSTLVYYYTVDISGSDYVSSTPFICAGDLVQIDMDNNFLKQTQDSHKIADVSIADSGIHIHCHASHNLPKCLLIWIVTYATVVTLGSCCQGVR